jgi:hypothetical protein
VYEDDSGDIAFIARHDPEGVIALVYSPDNKPEAGWFKYTYGYGKVSGP